DLYYTADFSQDHVRGWVAQGTAADVVERLRMYEGLGFDGVTLRITSWNQRDQLTRIIDEVLPSFQ
ncbi:MAG: hypothetical protein ACR2OU_17975, partial [Thermomicrobiales bacterium]